MKVKIFQLNIFHERCLKMILVGFLGLNFRQILVYFSSFMHQGHMGFIFLKVQVFVYEKQFLLFPKFFSKSWDSEEKYAKMGLDPSLGPIRAQTFAKKFFK